MFPAIFFEKFGDWCVDVWACGRSLQIFGCYTRWSKFLKNQPSSGTRTRRNSIYSSHTPFIVGNDHYFINFQLLVTNFYAFGELLRDIISCRKLRFIDCDNATEEAFALIFVTSSSFAISASLTVLVVFWIFGIIISNNEFLYYAIPTWDFVLHTDACISCIHCLQHLRKRAVHYFWDNPSILRHFQKHIFKSKRLSKLYSKEIVNVENIHWRKIEKSFADHQQF